LVEQLAAQLHMSKIDASHTVRTRQVSRGSQKKWKWQRLRPDREAGRQKLSKCRYWADVAIHLVRGLDLAGGVRRESIIRGDPACRNGAELP